MDGMVSIAHVGRELQLEQVDKLTDRLLPMPSDPSDVPRH